MKRLYGDARFAPVATFYRDHFAEMRRRVGPPRRRRPVAGLVRHWDAGRLELLTCSATHCYLPGMLPAREGIRPQLELGVRGFERIVGRKPTGAWLAECAYHPSFDDGDRARRASASPSSTRTACSTRARARPTACTRPSAARAASPSSGATPSRASRSGRATRATRATRSTATSTATSASTCPRPSSMGEVAGDGSRLMTGLKYYRITGKDVEKAALPAGRRARAGVGARGQLRLQPRQAGRAPRGRRRMPVPPIVVAPYDAELYGHWWFEGPIFLEAVFRRLHEAGRARSRPSRCASTSIATRCCVRGHAERQLVGGGRIRRGLGGPEAALDVAARAPRDPLRAVAGENAPARRRSPRARRSTRSIRELLLLQSSDWPFILKTGTATRYAEARIRAHVHRLRHLGHLVETGTVEGSRRGLARRRLQSATTSSPPSPATSSARRSTEPNRGRPTPPARAAWC